MLILGSTSHSTSTVDSSTVAPKESLLIDAMSSACMSPSNCTSTSIAFSSSASKSSVMKYGQTIFNAASTASGVSAMDKMTTMTSNSSNPMGNKAPVDPDVA